MKHVYIPVSSNFSSEEQKLKEKFDSLTSEIGENIEDVTQHVQSAVLIPLILNQSNQLEVLLTVRKKDIALVAGEVCLPGGRRDGRRGGHRYGWCVVGRHGCSNGCRDR